MSAKRSVLLLLFAVGCLLLFSSLAGSIAYAVPPTQGGSYDHQAAARFVGKWQSPNLSVTIEDRPTEFFVGVQAPRETATQLCPNGASSCDIWVPGPLFTRDGKLIASWTRDDGTQVWSEFAILGNGHLLWTSTLSYSQGGTEIIRVELVRMSGSTTAAPTSVPGSVPTISLVLPTVPPLTLPPQPTATQRLTPTPQATVPVSPKPKSEPNPIPGLLDTGLDKMLEKSQPLNLVKDLWDVVHFPEWWQKWDKAQKDWLSAQDLYGRGSPEERAAYGKYVEIGVFEMPFFGSKIELLFWLANKTATPVQ